MKINYSKYFWVLLFTITQVPSFSQGNKDSLKEILSSKTFTLEEEYSGDWGGYVHLFTFIVEHNNVRVKCANYEPLKDGEALNVLVPISELKNLELLFTSCNSKVMISKSKSTEHITYKLKNKHMTYSIDDRYTMACDKDFRAWKELLLLVLKQNKNK